MWIKIDMCTKFGKISREKFVSELDRDFGFCYFITHWS